jgi:hypothetical protein
VDAERGLIRILDQSLTLTQHITCASHQLLRQVYASVSCLLLLPTVGKKGCGTINTLPDDVLLLIFHFDRVIYLDGLNDVDKTVASVLEVASASSCVPEVEMRVLHRQTFSTSSDAMVQS